MPQRPPRQRLSSNALVVINAWVAGKQEVMYILPPGRQGGDLTPGIFSAAFPARNNPIVQLVCNWREEKPREKSCGKTASGRTLLYEIKMRP
jgi:tRNA (Thr-GGU) A37 N-methylase